MTDGHFTLRGHKETKFDDDLAVFLGVPAAVVLGKVHMWLNRECTVDNIFDGRRWVYNPYKRSDKKKEKGIREGHSWEENFPFYSLNTIKRAFNKLEGLGLLLSGEFNKLDGDRTKWYTIDYAKLEELLPYNSPPLSEGDTPSTQNGSVGEPLPHPSTQIESVGEPKMGRSLPVTTKTLATESQPSVDPLKKKRNGTLSSLSEMYKLRYIHEGQELKLHGDIAAFTVALAELCAPTLRGLLGCSYEEYVTVFSFVIEEQLHYQRVCGEIGKSFTPMVTTYCENRWFGREGKEYFVYDYYSRKMAEAFKMFERPSRTRKVKMLADKFRKIDQELDIDDYLQWLREWSVERGWTMITFDDVLKDGHVEAYRNRGASEDIAIMTGMLER
jgi:hypothetical protein